MSGSQNTGGRRGFKFKTIFHFSNRILVHQNIFNHDFLLPKVSPADEGEYICQVSAYKPSDLTHKLAVRGEKDKLIGIKRKWNSK
jgi:hypothetical protein